mgnify:CR=1 FL=1
MTSESSFHTTDLHLCLARMRAGDQNARDELLRGVEMRVELLARKMLRDFPSVRRLEETGDVYQAAALRLLRCLESVSPASMRDLYSLAATQIRRELLDLARYHRRRIVAVQLPVEVQIPGAEPQMPVALVTPDLDEWFRFHEAVDSLPNEEREVVGLIFYHGWTRQQVAELFDVTERTVRRWWVSALVRLKQKLGDQTAGQA